jgi:hypothetical protein
MKLLILGGYGVFGGRLAHLLADLPGKPPDILLRKLKDCEQAAAADTPSASAKTLPIIPASHFHRIARARTRAAGADDVKDGRSRRGAGARTLISASHNRAISKWKAWHRLE